MNFNRLNSRQSLAVRILAAVGLVAFWAILMAVPAHGQNITKANNATILSTTTSWTGNVVPTASENALFNNTLTSSVSATVGAGLSVGGIIVTNTGGNFTISANGTKTLTIGASGIDLSSAANSNNNFTIAAPVVLGAAQSFNVASGRTLTVSGNINTSGDNLTLVGAGAITLSGVISGSGNLIQNSTGTTSLTNTSTYTGATIVNAGTLLLDLSTKTTGVLASTTKPTLGGGTLDVQGKSTGASSQTLGNLTLTANTGSNLVINGNGGTGTTLTLGSTLTRGAGSTLNIDISAPHSILASATTTTSGILNAGVTVTDANGTGFATTSGGDVVRYTSASQLAASSNNATTNYFANNTGTLKLNGSASVNSLDVNATSTGTLDLHSGTLTVTSGGLLDTATAGYTIANGTLGASGKELIVQQFSGSTLTVSATISGGTGSLTKDGQGSLILTGNNNFTGATVISGGTLTLAATGSNKALDGTSSLIINTGGTLLTNTANQTGSSTNLILSGGTLALNGQTDGSASTAGLNLLTLTANSTIDLGSSGGSVLYVGNSSAATWAAGTTLDITNWDGTAGNSGTNDIFFGSGASALTSTQLAQIDFFNASGQEVAAGAALDSSGRLITPVPEPSTYFAGGALVALVGLREWRRRQSRAKTA
ncbi:MAG TPA: autotransporter-associated beta strand repeat-containing protein [Opitutales bacterium]|nr:autotransporter-associated beta strand repeat-containing protein [Opitutales bacterium]